VEISYFTEYHGKSICDSFFGLLSRVYDTIAAGAERVTDLARFATLLQTHLTESASHSQHHHVLLFVFPPFLYPSPFLMIPFQLRLEGGWEEGLPRPEGGRVAGVPMFSGVRNGNQGLSHDSCAGRMLCDTRRGTTTCS
jgi:hypothetical protein